MREYKFRGKRVDNGEWVYGNYFIDERDIEDGFIWRDIPQIQQRYGDHYQYYDVDPSTVGQYTGLKDKNGKEIYEGDIIKLCDTNPILFRVETILARYGYKTVFKLLDDGTIAQYYFLDKCEVVGNIHDNPELLKEGSV